MSRLVRIAIAVIALTCSLGACATLTGGRGGGSFCEVEKPVRPSSAELAAMSPARKRETLAHNKFGARQCGWRP